MNGGSLAERIARHLAEHGPRTTTQLAKELKDEPRSIGDSIRQIKTRARYGIYIIGKEEDHQRRGPPTNIWAVDKIKLRAYLENRMQPSSALAKPKAPKAPKAKPPKVKKASVKEFKYDPNHQAPVYDGPQLTRWQPSSPYYKCHKGDS